jgi:L-cysteine:1D-myo-inositol 2-amino-2-deoxy-alpha-D-glucopyranoside ligase
MHTGMVRLDGQKMSKSLGNLVLARDLLRDCSAAAIRLYLLSFPYREGWDFQRDALPQYEKLAGRLRAAAPNAVAGRPDEDPFFAALDDDLGTPAALKDLESRLQQAEAGDGRAAESLALYRYILGA